MKSPVRPNARGIYQALLDAAEDIGLQKEELSKKLVGSGSDGASVMVGNQGGVAASLRKLQPSIIVVLCLAHRLELSIKDAKKDQLYDRCLALLLGLYYQYHNSPKQRLNLHRRFDSLNHKCAMPTTVGGTRWVGHLHLAVGNFLKGCQAIPVLLQCL